MPVAVLVHGGLHGGWCWVRVARLLAQEGWTVHAPSLTGLGDRKHLLRPDVTHETHVQDVLGILESNDLANIVLCGHSSGGSVVTAVADRVPDRIDHLLYLDGNVPRSGQSAMDVLGEPHASALRALARASGEGWRIPASAFSGNDFGITDPSDAAWACARLADHPLHAFEDPVIVDGGADRIAKKTYCATELSGFAFTDRLLRGFQTTPGWETRLLTGVRHDAMLTDPELVHDLIAG